MPAPCISWTTPRTTPEAEPRIRKIVGAPHKPSVRRSEFVVMEGQPWRRGDHCAQAREETVIRPSRFRVRPRGRYLERARVSLLLGVRSHRSVIDLEALTCPPLVTTRPGLLACPDETPFSSRVVGFGLSFLLRGSRSSVSVPQLRRCAQGRAPACSVRQLRSPAR